jgi:hypothetical protein
MKHKFFLFLFLLLVGCEKSNITSFEAAQQFAKSIRVTAIDIKCYQIADSSLDLCFVSSPYDTIYVLTCPRKGEYQTLSTLNCHMTYIYLYQREVK